MLHNNTEERPLFCFLSTRNLSFFLTVRDGASEAGTDGTREGLSDGVKEQG